MAEPVKLDLHAVVAKAKEMFAGREYPTEMEWADLKDWQRLSWMIEAADELGMEL